MKRFTLSVDLSNAAFDEDPHAELGRLLKEASRRVAQGDTAGSMRDYNGNHVGTWKIA